MHKEIEVKFKINKGEKITSKLLKLGGSIDNEYRQTTYGFFSKDSIKKGIFPRIRVEPGKHVLTVKVRPKKKTNYFERKEYSLEIDDETNGIKILKLLGFNRVREFTKKRQEWKFPNVEVYLDILYFGRFLEIEGTKKNIEKMIKRLGFEKRERITKAYLAIEDDYKKIFKQ
jgi:predicted adenylyl cyclase CyaB